MNINNLSNNMRKPRFFEYVYIPFETIKINILKSPELINNYELYLNLDFHSLNEEEINYNPIELINYFSKNSNFKLIDWDDNKEFDFSITNIINLTFKLSNNYFYDFLKLVNFDLDHFNNFIHTDDFNFFKNELIKFIIPDIEKNVNIKIIKDE